MKAEDLPNCLHSLNGGWTDQAEIVDIFQESRTMTDSHIVSALGA